MIHLGQQNCCFSFGSSDSTFVVERTEYSKNQWVRVADFTTELDTVYKSFTIEGTSAGEYRFRLKATNGQIIATGESYKQLSSCLNGIESIKKNAPDAEIVTEE